jgi:cell division ATPase FtsA
VRIISESRAALISACQSRHFQVGYDILSRPVLVVDMGSSTTDFAYISSGREVELQTAGEVALGGGIMDELLLDASVEASPDKDELRRVFEQSPPWRTYCEFAARRLKEKYFADEDYWRDKGCTQTVTVMGKKRLRLELRMNAELADRILEAPAPQLKNRSFHKVFAASLQEIHRSLQEKDREAAGKAGGNTLDKADKSDRSDAADAAAREAANGLGHMPELLFLTGGVSRMPALREWCREAFPEAIVITGAEPEYSVSRGLAYSGRIDEEIRAIIDAAFATCRGILTDHADKLKFVAEFLLQYETMDGDQFRAAMEREATFEEIAEIAEQKKRESDAEDARRKEEEARLAEIERRRLEEIARAMGVDPNAGNCNNQQ